MILYLMGSTSGYLGSLLSSSDTYVWNLAFRFPCWISKETFATGFTVVFLFLFCVWGILLCLTAWNGDSPRTFTHIFKYVWLERWVFEGNAKKNLSDRKWQSFFRSVTVYCTNSQTLCSSIFNPRCKAEILCLWFS